jgi:hypothetical protein
MCERATRTKLALARAAMANRPTKMRSDDEAGCFMFVGACAPEQAQRGSGRKRNSTHKENFFLLSGERSSYTRVG